MGGRCVRQRHTDDGRSVTDRHPVGVVEIGRGLQDAVRRGTAPIKHRPVAGGKNVQRRRGKQSRVEQNSDGSRRVAKDQVGFVVTIKKSSLIQ